MFSDTGCTMLNWLDTKNVFLCHTLLDINKEVEFCKRVIKDDETNTYISDDISRPTPMRLYNEHMNGTDNDSLNFYHFCGFYP